MRIVKYIIVLIALTSCSIDNNFECVLYRQRIPNSSKVIYDCFCWSKYNDSQINELAIIDSTESFSLNNILELPGQGIIKNYAQDSLTIYSINHVRNSEADTILIPYNSFRKKYKDMNINIVEYKTTYGSSLNTGLKEYKFDSTLELKDSIIFYGLKKVSDYKTLPEIYAFPKGNIKVIEDKENNILRIEIEEFICERSEIYKPSKPTQIVKNQPVVGITSYYLIPKNTVKSNILTDFGVYKQVR